MNTREVKGQPMALCTQSFISGQAESHKLGYDILTNSYGTT